MLTSGKVQRCLHRRSFKICMWHVLALPDLLSELEFLSSFLFAPVPLCFLAFRTLHLELDPVPF